jgi:hypothetical protein
VLQKLPSSQINLYCLSAEISKHQRYRSIYICVDPPCRSIIGHDTSSCFSMYGVYCMFLSGLNTDFVGNTNTIYIYIYV